VSKYCGRLYRRQPIDQEGRDMKFGVSLASHVTHLIHSPVSSSLLSSPLSSSITPSLFYSRLKTYLFNKSFPPQTSFIYRTAYMTTRLDRTYHAHRFIFSFTFKFFVCSVWCHMEPTKN